METIDILGVIALVAITTAFFIFYGFKIIKDNEKKSTERFKNLNEALGYDSREFDRSIRDMWGEVGNLTKILYKPLYDVGNIVYFKEKDKEIFGEITSIDQRCGEQSEYLVRVGKLIHRVKQEDITGWK
jgi:hypothetical protein